MAVPFGAMPFNPNKSFEVAEPPSDGISSLSFNPKTNYLVSTSWDKIVRCWEIQSSGQSVPKAMTPHDQPVLCSTWKDDGQVVFTGGCDKQVKAWNLFANTPPVQVGAHDAPVKDIAWIPELKLLVSASWDKTLKYWDTRTSNPAHTQQLAERPHSMDARHPLLVVATADRNIVVFNLQNPQTEFKRIASPLKFQTRCVTTFPDKQGFLVGSIEGRVAVQHLDENLNNKNFTFKCHRDGNDIYAVNSINFHPVYGTFATAGGDGAYNFWDKDSKQRLKALQRCNMPIPCSAFNHDGSIYAYAVGYDWSKGAENHNPATAKNHIFLHPTSDAEVKAKPKTNTTGNNKR